MKGGTYVNNRFVLISLLIIASDPHHLVFKLKIQTTFYQARKKYLVNCKNAKGIFIYIYMYVCVCVCVCVCVKITRLYLYRINERNMQ